MRSGYVSWQVNVNALNSSVIFSLVYISREAAPMTRDAMRELLGQSRPNNASAGITGLLVHKAGYFLQILEGPREPVELLMAKIQKDTRHLDVTILLRTTQNERQFGDWSMALADWPDEDAATTRAWAELLETFRSSRGQFSPASGLVDFALSLASAGYLE